MKIYSDYVSGSFRNRKPFAVMLELTKKCNFNCAHCYLGLCGDQPLQSRPELTTDEWKRIVDKLDELGIIFVQLTGGEIFLRSDVMELIRYMRSKNLIVSMFSNGSLLTPEIASELKKLKVFYIAFSLHAACAELQDSISGIQGSFDQILRAIRIARSEGLETVVKVSIGKKNVHELDAMIRLGDEMDVALQLAYMTMPDQSGKIAGDFVLSEGPELRTVIKKVREYNRKRQPDVETPGECSPEDRRDSYLCSGLMSSFCVNSDGTVSPCPGANYWIGDLLNEPFGELWHSPAALDFVQRQRPEECRSCKLNDRCSPCPAYSVNKNRDINKIDKYVCSLIKELNGVYEETKE